MQRLAALVPRPRLHLIRFHRVLAPNANRKGRMPCSGDVQDEVTLRDHPEGARPRT